MEDFKPSDLINARAALAPMIKPKEGPKIDVLVSKAVGKTVYVANPKLIEAIVERKKAKNGGDDVPDNFLEDPKFVEKLKKIL